MTALVASMNYMVYPCYIVFFEPCSGRKPEALGIGTTPCPRGVVKYDELKCRWNL
jgi:hypothetical protein